MAFNAERRMRQFDPEEREAILDFLLESAAPKDKHVPTLIDFAETIEEAKQYLAEDGKIIGLSTGWDSVDQMFMGMKPGELEIVYGPTKHRKSMFVQNIAAQVANAGHPVLFVGLELIGAQNTERWLKMGYDILPIVYPQDIPGYKDIDALVEVAVERGVELVVVDHLHMWRGEGENEQAGITAICQEMKRVAMKYQVPLILVSHISRDKTALGAPSVNLLKGSTSIAQLADKVICVYSPGVEYDDGIDNIVQVSIPLSRRLPNARSAELVILANARLVER